MLEWRDGRGYINKGEQFWGRPAPQTTFHPGKVLKSFKARSGLRGHFKPYESGSMSPLPPLLYGYCKRFTFKDPLQLDNVPAQRRDLVLQGLYRRWKSDSSKVFCYSAGAAASQMNARTGNPFTGDSLHFKFQIQMLPQSPPFKEPRTGRTITENPRGELQFHPNGGRGGTYGCIGLQDWQDCCEAFIYLNYYYLRSLKVEATDD